MKTRNFAKGLLFGASLLLASAAFAGEKGSVKLYEDVKVNGKTLAAGNYNLAWEGSGSNVQLSIRGRPFAVIAWVEPGRLGTRLRLFFHVLLQFGRPLSRASRRGGIMKNKGVCFGCSAGSGVRNPSTSPMKRGASSVRSVAAARTAARGRPSG